MIVTGGVGCRAKPCWDAIDSSEANSATAAVAALEAIDLICVGVERVWSDGWLGMNGLALMDLDLEWKSWLREPVALASRVRECENRGSESRVLVVGSL
jgi:hypothetical protein